MGINLLHFAMFTIGISVLTICCEDSIDNNGDEEISDSGMKDSSQDNNNYNADGGDADASADGSAIACEWRKMYEATENISALNDIWGSDVDNIYAVGFYSPVDPLDDGVYPVILHYDGASWKEFKIEGLMAIYSIWGINDKCIFISNNHINEIMHFNGAKWDVVEINQASTMDIWGSSETYIFAVGDNTNPNDMGNKKGNIFHYDGNKWSLEYESEIVLEGIWGSSNNDVYAVGATGKLEGEFKGIVIHNDGQTWTETRTESYEIINDVWGFSASDVIIIKANYNSEHSFDESSIWRKEGINWVEDKAGIPEYLEKISGSSSEDIYVTGSEVDSSTGKKLDGVAYHYNGNDWELIELEGPWEIHRIWSFSKNEAFAVGRNIDDKTSLILQYSCD